MKIQNKYVFRIIISVFLYFVFFKKKVHGFGIVARSRCLGQARPWRESDTTARPKARGSSMFIWVWQTSQIQIQKVTSDSCLLGSDK